MKIVCSLTLLGFLAAAGCGDSDDDQKDAAAATGPGATLKCTSSGKNAFDTYGTTGFVAVNKSIIANVMTEMSTNGTTNLGDSFTKIGTGVPASTSDNAAMFEGKLAAFLVYAYGGPEKITYTDGVSYTGPQDMVTAHTGLNITSAQFDYFVSNVVVPALTTNGVSADDVTSCFAPVVTSAAFKASIVGK